MALSPKQAAFVNEYFIDYNATRAAERAGYKGNTNTLAVTGHDLLRNPKISEVVSARLSAQAMTADEVLNRLADHARGSMGDFLQVNDKGQPYFDVGAASKANKLHLVKKFKTKTRSINLGRADEDESNTDEEQDRESLITEVIIEFELYDAQAALVQIGKHHKLFVDKVEHSGNVNRTDVEVYLPDNGRQDRN